MNSLEKYLRREGAFPEFVSSEVIEELEKQGHFGREYSPEYVFYPIGIEIEVEQCGSEAPHHFFWSFKGDGSLRNGGVEAITPPLPTAQCVGFALEEFKKKFLVFNSKYDFSWRTGIHIHICPLPFTGKDIVKSFLMFAVLEPLLFKVFAENRRSSIFCVPLMDSDKCESLIRGMIESVEKEKEFDWVIELIRAWPQANKYSSINFFRLKDIGTIEFRHLPGTDNFEILKNWISILNLLLQYAEKIEYKELKKKLIEINTNSEYFVLIQDIFKNLSEILTIPNFEKYIEEGVKKAKSLFPSEKVSLKVSKTGSFYSYSKKVLEKKQERSKKYY